MDVGGAVKQIDQALSKVSFGQQPEALYQPMEYMIGLDRQRFYPLLTFWGCHLFSGESKKALMPALGVEVFHSFMMVHEDILEQNHTRNEHKSVHAKWNNNVAILSGDAMIFKAYELLLMVENTLVKSVVRKFNQCFTKVCEGKQLALNNPGAANHPDVSKLNPGALVSFSLQLGAMIGGASIEQGSQAAKLGLDLNMFWIHHKNQSSPPSLAPPRADSLSHLRFNSMGAAILQSFDEFDCDEERKHSFKLWAMAD